MQHFYSNQNSFLSFKRTKALLGFVLFLCFGFISNAQVATNGGSGLAATYPNLAAAITALNAATISSPVTITLTGNETAPVGGYAITAQGTALNTITIQGVTSTITAFTPQASGILVDGIFKLIGADFVILQNFTIQENAANTNSIAASNNMTEFGVAFFYGSITNGSQNNTIQNNTISLNRLYSNTFGIYSNTRHTAINAITAAEISSFNGSNSGNKIYSNTISNVDFGIALIGSNNGDNMDNGNDIGGSSIATGNTISNYGGHVSGNNSAYLSLTGSCVGIWMNHQINDNVSFNTVTGATNITTLSDTGLIGISKNFLPAQPKGAITANYNSNTISISNNVTVGAPLFGIAMQGLLPLPGAVFNCNNNLIQNFANGTSATTGSLNGIILASAPATFNVTGNVVKGFVSSSTSGGFTGISVLTNAVVNTLNISNNKFGEGPINAINFNRVNTGVVLGVQVAVTGASSTCNVVVSNNDFRGIRHVAVSSGAQTYINQAAVVASFTCNANTFTNLSANTTGAISFINQSYAATTGSKIVSNNSIVTGFTRTTASGALSLVTDTAASSNGTISNVINNNFSNITVSGTATITGLNFLDGSASATKTVTDNTFDSWIGGTGALVAMNFPSLNGVSSFSNNTITNINGQGIIDGIVLGSTSNNATSVSIANNTINNFLSNVTGGNVSGISCSNTSSGITINNNSIHTLASAGATANVIGINVLGSNVTTGLTVLRNTIYNLKSENLTGASTVTGLQVGGLGIGNLVHRNFIYDLKSDSNSIGAAINGIRVAGGTNTFRNNFIAIGTNTTKAIGDAATNSSSVGINGIYEFLGTNNFFNNSVYISGAPTIGVGSSYAFNGTQVVNTRNFRNNIFFNARSNSGATGKNYAIKINGTAVNPAGLTLNNNIYFANGTNGLLGFFNGADVATLAQWKIATGQDASSFQSNPQFVNANLAIPDLHISPTSPTAAEGNGFDLGILDDFDGQSRSGLTPVDIGADAGNFVQLPLSITDLSKENGLIVYVKNDMINIKSTKNMTDLKVYDLAGRLVYEKSKINTKDIELNDLRKEYQMLLIQITADGKTTTKKLVF